jgi:hypothetical protein
VNNKAITSTTVLAPEDKSNNTLSSLATEREARVLCVVEVRKLRICRCEPVSQLILRPIAGCYNQKGSRSYQRSNSLSVALARMSWLVLAVHKRDGVECAFVKDNIEPVSQPIARSRFEQIPAFESESTRIILSVLPLFGDLASKAHAGFTVIHSDHLASPGLFIVILRLPKSEQHMTIPSAEV